MSEIMVETFEQTEMTALGKESEVNAEARVLIEKMGLEGQQALMIDTNERCPYREMSIEERNVYSVLFPEKTDVKKYSYGYIPLRVLQIAAHADSMGIYTSIFVWSERVKPTDPILVGVMKKDEVFHILARWGEALDSFDKLKEKAITVLMAKRIAGYKTQIAESEKNLKAICRETVAESFNERYFYV